MPRNKMDDERIPQILEAFQRCIVKYGLAQSSLERVAKEAGLSRTLIHHYIGGRNEVLEAWLEQVTRNRQEIIDQLSATSIEALLDQLQTEDRTSLPKSRIIQNELEAVAARDMEIRDILRRRVEYFVHILGLQLAKLYPQASEKQCADAAYILIALFQGHIYLREKDVSPPTDGALRRAALSVLNQLLAPIEGIPQNR